MMTVTFKYRGKAVTAVVKETSANEIYAETNPTVLGKKYWKLDKTTLKVLGAS